MNWQKSLALIVLLLMSVLQLHNAWAFPVTRGFDTRAHIEFIEYIQTQHKLPLANEGWEMHQAPLYYMLMSGLPSLKVVQFFGVVLWGLLIWLGYVFLSKTMRLEHDALIGTAVLTLLPLGLYLSPTISNEFFSAVVISATLVFHQLIYRKNFSITASVAMGILLGVCILAKATGLVFLIAFVGEQVVVHRHHLGMLVKKLAIVLSMALMIGGWFYVRNMVFFQNPVISAADFIPLSSFAQPVIPRTLWFLLNPLPLLRLDLFGANQSSLWVGTLFSWIYDGHTVLVPVQPFTKAGSVLALLWLPLCLIAVFGFLRTVRQRDRTLIIFYTVLLLLAYIWYNFQLPFYSTVKGAFISSLLLPFIYYFTYELQYVPTKVRKYSAIYVLLISLITLKHFWVIPSWYPYN